MAAVEVVHMQQRDARRHLRLGWGQRREGEKTNGTPLHFHSPYNPGNMVTCKVKIMTSSPALTPPHS
jgi:hypothetical protein